MTEQVHHAVADIYRRSPTAFSDSSHLIAALSDYVDTDGSGAGEVRLIVDAVMFGSFERLHELTQVGAGPHDAIRETAAVLSKQRATDEQRSAWACAVLAFATGLVSDADVAAYRAQWAGTVARPAPPVARSAPAPVAPAPVVPPPTAVPAPTAYQPAYQPAYQQTYAPQYSTAYPSAPTPPRSGVPLWAVLVPGVVLLLVVVGLVAWLAWPEPDEAERESGGGGGVTAPQVGACHVLTIEEITANDDDNPTVPCEDAAANTVTTDVVTLPEDVDMLDDAAVWAAIHPQCVGTTLSYLGGNAEAFARSAYDIIWFVPTAEELDAGARWVRCDLRLLAGGGTKPLPEVNGSLDELPLGDEVALCTEDQANGYLNTTCDLPHAYRATSSYYQAGERPTDDALADLGADTCDDGTGTYSFASAPVQEYWDAGATYLVCFTFDS